MKTHLISAYERHKGLDVLSTYAPMDSIGRHESCANADDADAILFVENTQFDDLFFSQLMHHPLVLHYPDKTFMYNEMDRPWDVLPGLYCCLTKKNLDLTRHRAVAYLYSPNPYVSDVYSQERETRYLYSFMGLYETLEAGRVPVIISDQWVPPPETHWSFAIQVEERRISSIPGLLSSLVSEAHDRSEAARQAWLHSYASDTMFSTVGDSLQLLMQTGSGHRHRRPSVHLNKWLAGENLLTRTATQRLRRHH